MCLLLFLRLLLFLLGSFGHVNLDLTVEEINIESSVDNNAVSGRIEYVADCLSVGEGMIADILLDTS